MAVAVAEALAMAGLFSTVKGLPAGVERAFGASAADPHDLRPLSQGDRWYRLFHPATETGDVTFPIRNSSRIAQPVHRLIFNLPRDGVPTRQLKVAPLVSDPRSESGRVYGNADFQRSASEKYIDPVNDDSDGLFA
jgi:hypothetical protein